MKAPEAGEIAPRDPDEEQPVFDEPWQAQVLALAYGLAERDVFSPAQWSEALGAALRRAEADGEPDDQQTYYEAALAALEQLVAAKGSVTGPALAGRIEQWRRAYLNTPHGKPVELEAGRDAEDA